MKILLLEDDMLLSEIMTEFLDAQGYEVTVVYNGLEAEETVYDEKFDLLLLDVNVPKLNGFQFLKSLRKTGDKTPAIFITSLHHSEDVVQGFESGADDYIKKPFELAELQVRIENVKKHFHLQSRQKIKIDDMISYDPQMQVLTIKEELYKLPKKEAEVFEYFVMHKQQTVSRDELVANLWNYEDAPSDATIRTYIKNLRKLLGEARIINIKGVGYRLDI